MAKTPQLPLVSPDRSQGFHGMDIEWLSQLGLPALVGGIAGSAAFYFQWDVEKRRAKLARRSSMVDTWRRNLLEDWPTQNGIGVVPPGGHSVCSRPDYASLRPHLSEQYRSQIEGSQPDAGKLSAPTKIIVGYDTLRLGMVSEIGRIERAWGLV